MHQDRISVNSDLHPGVTTYHDSCQYGRNSLKAFGHGYFEEARVLSRSCCPEFVDMIPSGNGNYCCGAGGGGWALPWPEERIFHGRVKAGQIKDTDAKRVIVSCPICRDQLKNSLNKEFSLGVEVKYLWEIIADSLLKSDSESIHIPGAAEP